MGVPRTRRDFMKATLGGMAVGAAGGIGLVAPRAMRGAVTSRTISKPIRLRQGESLRDVELVLAEGFQFDSTLSAVYSSSPDVTVKNVTLRGSPNWQSRWNSSRKFQDELPGGMPADMAGIRFQKCPRAVLDGVRVEGFPREGIVGFGLDNAVIRDVQITRCFMGLRIQHYAPNHNVHVSNVHVRDLWGSPRKLEQHGESKLHPGVSNGGDGLALTSLRDSTIEDCSVLGEQYASYKLTHPMNVTGRRLRGISLMVQGTADRVWKIHKEPCRGTRILDSTFDKSLGSGAIAKEGNGLQISINVADLLIKNCSLKASGKGGSGLQVAIDSHARIEGCTFEGFNGMRGNQPCYAIDVLAGCSINEDFEALNTFVDQHRLIRRA